MKATVSKYLEILIESVNYIIINYALSNMALLFRSNPLFILFFASEIWMFGNYWKKMDRLTANKAISSFLLIVCFFIHIVRYTGSAEFRAMLFLFGNDRAITQ